MQVKNCECKKLERLREKSEKLSLENKDLRKNLNKTEQKLGEITEYVESIVRTYNRAGLFKIPTKPVKSGVAAKHILNIIKDGRRPRRRPRIGVQ